MRAQHPPLTAPLASTAPKAQPLLSSVRLASTAQVLITKLQMGTVTQDTTALKEPRSLILLTEQPAIFVRRATTVFLEAALL